MLFNKVKDSKSHVLRLRGKLFTSGDIELSPGPVSQGNNLIVLKSR